MNGFNKKSLASSFLSLYAFFSPYVGHLGYIPYSSFLLGGAAASLHSVYSYVISSAKEQRAKNTREESTTSYAPDKIIGERYKAHSQLIALMAYTKVFDQIPLTNYKKNDASQESAQKASTTLQDALRNLSVALHRLNLRELAVEVVSKKKDFELLQNTERFSPHERTLIGILYTTINAMNGKTHKHYIEELASPNDIEALSAEKLIKQELTHKICCLMVAFDTH